MNRFEQYMQYRLLDHKFSFSNIDLTEMTLNSMEPGEQVGNIEIKQVCAKLPVPFVERMDSTVSMLGISKRKFIEMALNEAMNRVDQLAKDLDVDELLVEMEEAREEMEKVNGDSK